MARVLRPATSDDSEFCYVVHERSLGPVVVEVFGPWDEKVQRSFHARWFVPGRVKIIEDDDQRPIGVFDVRDEEDYAYLARVELLPEYQGRGIGTRLIRALQASGRPVRLDVFTANVRARVLYERLGFRVEGEHEGRLTMSYSAGASIR